MALGTVHIIDMHLKGRVRLEYVSGVTGALTLVGRADTTTPEMLLAAKSFRVTVLSSPA